MHFTFSSARVARKLYLLFCILFIQIQASSQSAIKGIIKSVNGQPLSHTSIQLYTKSSNQPVKSTESLQDGTYHIEGIEPGQYYLQFSLVGFETQKTASFPLLQNVTVKDAGIQYLKQNSKQLADVIIVSKKSLVEQKTDRLVINVAGSITSAGSTALEVLERSPGVTVNRQDNSIALSGKSGVVIMINGRMNYMTPEAAIQMLNGLSANAIEKIELLSTPPSNLDAEGNAGYINIILKKNENEGWNGYYAGTLGYGWSSSGKGETGNASININYRKKKWYFFSDYSYLRFAQSTELVEDRNILLNGNYLFSTATTDFAPLKNNHNARLGFDYQYSKKISVSGLLSGYVNRETWNMQVMSTLAPMGIPDTFIYIRSKQDDQWQHLGANLGFQYKPGDNETFSISADYLHYNNNSPVTYDNDWKDKYQAPIRKQLIRSSKETPISIAVGKADYARNIGQSIKMETGIKYVYSRFSNNIELETLTGNNWVKDPELTAKYKLKESITAAYISVEMKMNKKITAKAGIRYEYTRSNLGTDSIAGIVDRKYGQFFPSLFMSYAISDKSTIGISYSRRITRPSFNQLAPFIVFSDPYTFFAGNPALQPGISNNVKTDYRNKNLLVTCQYSHEDSTIVRFQSRVQPGTNRQYNISENLKNQKIASVTIGGSFNACKWWTMYINGAGIWQEVQAYNNGYLNTFNQHSFTASTTQTFTLPAKYSIEISGNYNSGRLWGIFRTKPFGAVNAGLQKKFSKNNSKLSLGFDNIFNTLVYRYHVDLPEQNQQFNRVWQWAQPTIKLSWTSSLGNQKMKAAAKKIPGADEERSRVD
mgnify:CR=1 FL=1